MCECIYKNIYTYICVCSCVCVNSSALGRRHTIVKERTKGSIFSIDGIFFSFDLNYFRCFASSFNYAYFLGDREKE